MGTNDNRDRKLQPNEKAIWQHAFKASLSHTSVEGAERNGWKAVDACYRAGMFHEDKVSDKETASDEYPDAWKALLDFFTTDEGTESLTIDEPHRLVELMDRFHTGTISFVEFKNQLRELDSFV